MKMEFLAGIFAVAALASCASKNETTSQENAEAEAAAVAEVPALTGKWLIGSIVLSDTASVNPAAEEYVAFTDTTYFIQTGCNTFSGAYELNGDSIILGEGPATLMMCPDMTTEDAIRQILPGIATVSADNDSTIRLNGPTPSQYILLRKAAVTE